MKTKTSELIDEALNYAVALCEGYDPSTYMKNIDVRLDVQGKCSALLVPINREYVRWQPSTNWAQGGPIIEREAIELTPYNFGDEWGAVYPQTIGAEMVMGTTPLIAAMRCYVASKLGDEIEIPEKLL